jgi:sulfur carrier protein ThiS
MMVAFRLMPEGESVEFNAGEGDTYEDALLSLGINPDIVLIFYKGVSLPQDKRIEEPEVEIVSTCSRG